LLRESGRLTSLEDGTRELSIESLVVNKCCQGRFSLHLLA